MRSSRPWWDWNSRFRALGVTGGRLQLAGGLWTAGTVIHAVVFVPGLICDHSDQRVAICIPSFFVKAAGNQRQIWSCHLWFEIEPITWDPRDRILTGDIMWWYTLCSEKKHPLTFSFISPWVMCRFKQKLQWMYLRNGGFWQCRN